MNVQPQEDLYEYRILVIEDNIGDFILIEDYLLEQFHNINVIRHPYYRTALEYIRGSQDKLDIILLDLNLTELSGMDLITDVLKQDFEIPIIILTGYVDLEMAKKSLQVGIYDYLLKDEINPTILHKTITFTINRSSFINQIEQEKQNYEKLFNFNPQPTWLLDAHTFKIINANIAAQLKYGLSQHDFLKMSFLQLHPSDEGDIIINRLTSTENESTKNQFTHLLGSGKKIKVNIFCTEINSNFQRRLIVQSNDISETLHHINTIEIQNERLKNIAWTQSHLVRAPISRILGIIDLLQIQEESPEELQFWMEQLKVSTQEMDDVVKKIVIDTNLLTNE